MKSLLHVMTVLMFVLFSSIVYAQEKITLANGEWAPYLSEKLKHYGVASHIVSESFALSGVEVAYKWYGDSWNRAYKDTKDGKVQGSLIWSNTPEREAEMYFSDAVISGTRDMIFYLKKNPFDWRDINDFKGKKIGGVLGYTYGTLMDNAEKEGAVTIDRVANEPINFQKMLKGRIDFLIANEDIGLKLISEQLSKEEAELIAVHPKPLNEKVYYLILTKAIPENKAMIEKFNAGLKQLKASGRYDRYLRDSKAGKYE